MRILVLVHEFPPVGGGGGRVVEDIYRGMHQRGHEAIVVTPYIKGLSRYEEANGVKIQRISSGRRSLYKATLFDMAAYIVVGFIHSLKLIRRWEPDVIHVHFAVPAGALAWALTKITKIPYVITAHLGDVPGGVPAKTDKWFKWIYPLTPMIWNKASKVTAISEHTRRLAKKHYAPHIHVIPNGVDLDELIPGEIKFTASPRIVFAGRIVAQKNPIFIIQILNRIKDIPWDCVILGDGELKESVENEIKRHNLQDRISLHGWVYPNVVVEWFSKSHILLMPSLWEGLPVVGVQALALGLAVIASPVGGLLDLVVPGKNGFLVEGNRVDAWEEKLRVLLTDPQKLVEFRKYSRYVAEKFSLSKIVQSYEEILLRSIEHT